MGAGRSLSEVAAHHLLGELWERRPLSGLKLLLLLHVHVLLVRSGVTVTGQTGLRRALCEALLEGKGLCEGL